MNYAINHSDGLCIASGKGDIFEDACEWHGIDPRSLPAGWVAPWYVTSEAPALCSFCRGSGRQDEHCWCCMMDCGPCEGTGYAPAAPSSSQDAAPSGKEGGS